MAKSKSAPKVEQVASWLFGGITLLFLFGAYFVESESVSVSQHKILGFAAATCAGFFGCFFSGTIGVQFASPDNRLGKLVVRATGGVALFVLVLWFWHSPHAPLRIENNFIKQILQLFEAEVGYPPAILAEGFSREAYARRVQEFAHKHKLDERRRQILLDRIRENIDPPSLQSSVAGTNTSPWGNEIVSAITNDASAWHLGPGPATNQFEPLPVAIPSPTNVPSEIPEQFRNVHGAVIQMAVKAPDATIVIGHEGSHRAMVGELMTTLIRVRNLDGQNDSIVITNVVMISHTAAGSARSPNLIAAPVTLRKFGDALTVTNTFRILGTHAPEFMVEAEASGVDMHNGDDGPGIAQGFTIRFPGGQILVQ